MMKIFKKLFNYVSNVWIILAMIALAPAADVAAQSCEAPLFVQQGGQDANVILLFDSSTSMNRVITHPNYNESVSYSGPFNASRLYSCKSDGMYTPEDFDDDWDNSPEAFLVESDHGASGDYWGNYMNWIYYHASDAERSELGGTLTRVQGAKIATQAIINRATGMRLALWKLNGGDGATALTGLTTDTDQLDDELQAIKASGFTPLAEALEDIYDEVYDNSAMIEAWCQKTFIIMVTDGYPTFDQSVHSRFIDYDGDGNDPGDCSSIGAPPTEIFCSDHVDDVAAYLYQNDMMPGMGGPNPEDEIQNIVTYAIGFNIDAPILQDVADNGGGEYYTADDPEELYQALESALLDIVSDKASGTSAAIVSTEGSAFNKIFRASFTPGLWTGGLEAYSAPYTNGDTPLWDAADALEARAASTRAIYTSANGNDRIAFNSTNRSDLKPLLGASSDGVADDMIDWVRGNDVDGYRDRDGAKLGDISDSSPVPVGAPASFNDYLDYRDFRVANIDREPMVYVGANDGMIHAFRQSTGEEAWAYIPKNALGKLQYLMDPFYCHEYYVNATPAVFDAHVDGQWRTLLMAGQREGGDAYTLLDVTNPNNPELMWDKSLPVSESWVTPIIVRDQDLDRHVAVLGTGLDAGGDGKLLVVELSDGSVLHTEDLTTASGSNLVTKSVSMDVNFDGYDDLIYTADLDGNVWRFNMTAGFPWDKTLLFSTHQPIQAPPTVTVDEYGNALVYVATGRYLEDADVTNTEMQSFYCIIDDHSGTTVYDSDMVDQTSSFNDIGTYKGWYINLVNAYGERHISGMALAAGTVYFTTFQPTPGACSSGGTSWLYELDYEDGSNSDNDDGSEDNNTDDRLTDLGDGIYSQPAVDLANEDILIQNTNTSIRTQNMRGQFQRVVVRSWRQIFQ